MVKADIPNNKSIRSWAPEILDGDRCVGSEFRFATKVAAEREACAMSVRHEAATDHDAVLRQAGSYVGFSWLPSVDGATPFGTRDERHEHIRYLISKRSPRWTG